MSCADCWPRAHARAAPAHFLSFLFLRQGLTIVGTTDDPVKQIAHRPRAHTDDIDYILDTLSEYLVVKLRREDISACFSGIRPLALEPSSLADAASAAGGARTARLSRNHVIDVGERGMISITGGKWTTYRCMAEECVDAAIRQASRNGCALSQSPTACATASLPLVGGRGFDRALYTRVAQVPSVARASRLCRVCAVLSPQARLSDVRRIANRRCQGIGKEEKKQRSSREKKPCFFFNAMFLVSQLWHECAVDC